jgi:hypothetical protein
MYCLPFRRNRRTGTRPCDGALGECGSIRGRTSRACRIVLIFASIAGAAFVPAESRAAPPKNESRFVPDPASVTRYTKGWRYPQAGWLVVHIEGGPYERGYQHGKLLAAEIADYIETLATIRSPKAPHESWRDTRMLSNALFLRRFDAEFLEEMKGIADGAAAEGAKFDGRRVDLVDIVTLNCEIEAAYLDTGLAASATGIDSTHFHGPQYSQPRVRPHEHCSAFAATGPATADGRIVLGHITMSDLENVGNYNVWLDVQPSQGRRLVMQTFPGGIHSGLDYYINDGGLIVAETTVSQTKFNPAGKPLASRIRRAVQYADSIDKAVEILTDASNGLYTNQWLFGDIKTGEIAMFELGTDRTRLWRSSRNEWLAGTRGFYWGCNNNQDLEVLKETVPDLAAKPANLVRHPRRRDKAWLALFEKNKGRIAEAFAFEAFSLPPLAAFPSCDAKFTTSVLAENLESWALFGPPLGRTWDPSPADRKKYPDVEALVSNDWTVLGSTAPSGARPEGKVVDLAPFPRDDEDDEDDDKKNPSLKFDARHPFAWRGTLLPKTPGDIWLATAFAEYEQVVALQNALEREQQARGEKDDDLAPEAHDLADLALFAHESRWLTATRRLGRDLALREIKPDPAQNEWYDIAGGKGVLLLSALRSAVGDERFDRLMDEFGQAHAGREVSTDEFVAHFRKGAGKSAAEIFETWFGKNAPAPSADAWSVYSFEVEPEQALIVYGTLADRAAQREAAELLQRTIARRFSNYSIPIKADTEVNEDDLRNRHLVLVGRPATNRIAAQCTARVPVTFGAASFTVRNKTYAHPDSAVIAAGENPQNPRYSVVIYAGLGAQSTWKSVQRLEPDELPPAQVILLPAGRKTARFRVPPNPPKVVPPQESSIAPARPVRIMGSGRGPGQRGTKPSAKPGKTGPTFALELSRYAE